MQSSLTLAFNALYKNHNDLEYSAYPIFHDRKKIVFAIVGIRKDIRAKFVSAIENCGVSVVGITFTSNAMSNGAMQLNSKVKNQNWVVVDVKDNYSNLAFIVGGKTLGYFDIPFGANCFSKDSVVFEEDLFDHRFAQLLVLNAKETAQKKKLTTPDFQDQPDLQGNSLDDQEDGLNNPKKIIFKSRQNKNLPKFMTRDLPNDEKGFVYENFRYIIKRVLEAIKNNYKIEGLSEVKVAYFNLPKDFSYLTEMANAEGGDNVEFLPLHNYHEKQVVLSNLELFGASLIKKHNVKNNF